MKEHVLGFLYELCGSVLKIRKLATITDMCLVSLLGHFFIFFLYLVKLLTSEKCCFNCTSLADFYNIYRIRFVS